MTDNRRKLNTDALRIRLILVVEDMRSTSIQEPLLKGTYTQMISKHLLADATPHLPQFLSEKLERKAREELFPTLVQFLEEYKEEEADDDSWDPA